MAILSPAELLQRHSIEYVQSRSGKYTTTCPNCSGGYLNVEIKRDGVVWFCHHCNQGDGENFEQREPIKPGDLGPIKAVFDYTDEQGALLFQVLRFEPIGQPKQFRQRKEPEQRHWSIKGVSIVPYRLPELIEAVGIGEIVFIVEGEKDVETLRAQGVPATCNPMGAGKWREDFAPFFAGADVVICCDNDKPGRDHAQQVARMLSGTAREIRLLDLKNFWPAIGPSDDVSDWFSRGGGSVELLWQYVEQIEKWRAPVEGNGHDHDPPPWEASGGAALVPISYPFPITVKEIPRRQWIVPGLLLRRHVTVLVAPPGSGKSLLTLQLALMSATGNPWADWHPRGRAKTLVINIEDDADEMRRRLYAAATIMNYESEQLRGQVAIAESPETIIIAKADNRTKTVIRTPMVENIIATIIDGGFDVVIIDPFAETFEGDENSNSELKWAAVLWREIARRTNCSVLLVHHTRKFSANAAGDMDAARGGGSLVGVARVVSTLFNMSAEEAQSFEVDSEKRHEYLRFDDAKANLSLVTFSARWFFKRTYTLDNASDNEPADEVGVLEPWKPPSVFDKITTDQARTILQAIGFGVVDDAGAPTGDLFTPTKKGGSTRWAGKVVQDHIECSDKEAQKLINTWIESGVLKAVKRAASTSRGQARNGLELDESKMPGTTTESEAL